VAFVLYIGRFFDPIRDLSLRFDGLMTTMARGERILSLINAPVEVTDRPGAIELPPIQGNVHFEKVSFHYMDDPQPVLRDIELNIPAGETVAFVGKTGAGKTTIIKLLARFHDPTEGRVLVDGFDLRDVTQKSLRRQMGIVLQDPFLFSGTVRENIRFGRLEATDSEVEEAARAVGADEFIRNLRLGYETPVEEGGVILSVGQRQLISFARALLADPRILILDEATSSIDTQTEQIIQAALARLLQGRTSFVIAHRLSPLPTPTGSWSWMVDGSLSRENTESSWKNRACITSCITCVSKKTCERAFSAHHMPDPPGSAPAGRLRARPSANQNSRQRSSLAAHPLAPPCPGGDWRTANARECSPARNPDTPTYPRANHFSDAAHPAPLLSAGRDQPGRAYPARCAKNGFHPASGDG
jgi:ABC-type multidrug transport system ATPase subunit